MSDSSSPQKLSSIPPPIALLSAEVLLPAVLNHLPRMCVTVFGLDYVYSHAFGPLLVDLKTRPDQVVGRSVREVYADELDKAEELMARYSKVLAGELEEEGLTFPFTRDGLYLEVHVTAVYMKGRIVGGIAATRDVTHREKNRQHLEALTMVDHLTGLANRRRLDRILARGLEAPSVLLALDLDGFKQVNDQHGHEAGDAMLVRVARSIEGSLRAFDIVARTGGDEFVIVLPKTTLEESLTVAARLRASVPMAPAIGVSIGAAAYTADSDDTRALLQIADRRMYQEKREKQAAR